MPGNNCAINECGTSRREAGVGIFGLPDESKEHYKEWRQKTLAVILKYRENNAEFKELLRKKSVFTCYKHYDESEIVVCK